MTAQEMVEALERLTFQLARHGNLDWHQVDKVRLKIALALALHNRPDDLALQKMWLRHAGGLPDLTSLCRDGARVLARYEYWQRRLAAGEISDPL